MAQKIEEIETRPSACAWRAREDADERIAYALETFSDFFENPEHCEKVDKVKAIMLGFFTVHNGVYVNARFNRGKPFTTVKIDRPDFPNHLSIKKRDEMFYKPLVALDCVPVFSKGTNSWLVKVQ